MLHNPLAAQKYKLPFAQLAMRGLPLGSVLWNSSGLASFEERDLRGDQAFISYFACGMFRRRCS
jgi:hypothetical protein